MEEMNSDVAVIGAGAAGFTSGVYLARKGKKVKIISKNVPATSLFSGAAYFTAIPEAHEEKFRSAITFFNNLISSAGYSMTLTDTPVHLITDSGGVIESSFFVSTSSATSINFLLNKKVLFAGINNLTSFIPELIVMRLKQIVKNGTEGFQTDVINLSGSGMENHTNPLQIAKALDTGDNFKRFKERLMDLKKLAEYDVIVLPPVLGIEKFTSNYQDLKNTIQKPAGELLSSIPSVNGVRLYKAMEKILQAENITLINGTVTNFSGNEKIQSINVMTSTGTEKVVASDYIYSPGRYLTGGIAPGRKPGETIFGFPVFYRGIYVTQYLHSAFHYNFFETQPGLSCGIMVDEKSRPLDETGKIRFSNLYCAGSIISGDCNTGIMSAIFTGFQVAGYLV